jgi:DNA-binding CsgD family transcriptional regulator
METMDSDVLTYQACCGLDGRIYHVDTGKRNGHLVPIIKTVFSAYFSETDLNDEDEKAKELFKVISADLTPTERRTWRKLLEGKTIQQIAGEEKTTRSAIYERIRGNSKGQGGMISKNEFVELWWLRRRLEYDENI